MNARRQEITHVKTVWIIVISGFRQDQGQPTGSQHLWATLHARHSDASTVVTYLPWNTNWAAIAEQVRMCSNGHTPQVLVAAYSWGAGHGFITLGKELRKRGLCIESAVLADPVYRHPLWSLSWLSLLPGRRIHVPDNVKRVRWFYQDSSVPAGHTVVAVNRARSDVCPGERLPEGTTHSFADDAKEYHEVVYAEFEEAINAQVAHG